ncbi:molybdopterin-dependent oxidoreductase [Bradyrhizobium sp. 13971]
MGVSDLIVIWGTNPVNTQVNVMTHASRARKERGAQDCGGRRLQEPDDEAGRHQDLAAAGDRWRVRLCRDACAVPRGICRSRLSCALYRLPRRAGSASEDPHAGMGFSDLGRTGRGDRGVARWSESTKRSFFRLGYGFTRSRNGAAQMHAASCIPVVTGAWQDQAAARSSTTPQSGVSTSSSSKATTRSIPRRGCSISPRSAASSTGDAEALQGGGPVKAMLIQNTNPMTVVPEQALVRQGFAREDLFVAVHEQFMTETAQMADIVLPATMFMEHDDLYYGGGHQHISVGPKRSIRPASAVPITR